MFKDVRKNTCAFQTSEEAAVKTWLVFPSKGIVIMVIPLFIGVNRSEKRHLGYVRRVPVGFPSKADYSECEGPTFLICSYIQQSIPGMPGGFHLSHGGTFNFHPRSMILGKARVTWGPSESTKVWPSPHHGTRDWLDSWTCHEARSDAKVKQHQKTVSLGGILSTFLGRLRFLRTFFGLDACSSSEALRFSGRPILRLPLLIDH